MAVTGFLLLFCRRTFSASSETANTDENADFLGFPSMNKEAMGRESQALGATFPVWNPTPLHLQIVPSTERSNEKVSKNHVKVGQRHQFDGPSGPTIEKQSSCVVAPQSSTVPTTENEIQFLDIELVFTHDLGPTFYDCNPFSDCQPLHISNSNEHSSEIVRDDSKYHSTVGQSQQIGHSSDLTNDEPSSDVVAPPNSTGLTIENGQNTSIFQPLTSFDLQMMDDLLAFQAVEYSHSASYDMLDLEFCQNNIGYSRPFDGGSTSNTRSEDGCFMEQPKRILTNQETSKENPNFGYEEVNRNKKKRKVNDGRRRCRCKRSKCVKRYCQCFSSGSYCDEACGCEDCTNTEQNETIVNKKRAQIEARKSNPFAPKIVPLDEEHSQLPGNRLSPRKGRNIRGCNCTKSKCIKQYCECYQGGVKCYLECRCQGCENIYTQRDDAGRADFTIGEAMNYSVNAYGFHGNGGEMLPQAESSNNNFEPLMLMPFENRRWIDPSSSMYFGNSMDGNTVFQGRRAEDGNLAPFSPPLNPYSMAMGSCISSVVPLQQWPPRESTSFGNSLSSGPTFVPPPLPPMNCYQLSVDYNDTPWKLNDLISSAMPIRANSPDRKRVCPPWFPVPGDVSGLSTPSLPSLIPSNDADGRSNGQDDGEENGKG